MKTCKQCGQPMASDATEGLCARCLLSAAIKEPAPENVTVKLSPASDFPDIADMAEVARRLPQFEIISLLGRGGMGVVYQARQVQLDRIVALKILPPAEALSPDFVERFRREARSLAKLSHPNIVHVYDFGETGGLYYFVMEFVDGLNLREMFRAQRLTPAEALAVVPKICDALQYAHEEGVVHRDIKPENILIDKRGRVKIADFGLAKLLRRDTTDATLTQSGMTLGTPRYMAPEQLDKPESVDHRADIYSLGVVFYEMLTGEVPMGRFAAPSQTVGVDVRLDEIVLRSLERDVERRYQHASEVRDDVEKVTSKPPVASAVPASTSASDAPVVPHLDEAIAILKTCLGVLKTSAIMFTILSSIGFGIAVTQLLKLDLRDALWNGLVLFATLLGASIIALGMLGQARRGRQRLAWIAALILVAVAALFEFLRRDWFPYLPPVVAIFFGAISLGCFLFLRFGPQMPAAFAAMATSQQRSEQAREASTEPRLSRLALWGAIWAPLVAAIGLPECVFFEPNQLPHTGLLADLVRERAPWFIALNVLLLILGGLAPFATTILGVLGLQEIKRSGGRVYGWRLAVADVLAFPLLALFLAISKILFSLLEALSLADPRVGSPYGALGSAVICFFVARAAWRAILGHEKQSTPPPATPDSSDVAKPIDHRVSEAITIGLPGWFGQRATWMQKLILLVLNIVMACATMSFLGYHLERKTEFIAGHLADTSALQIGQPSPWFTANIAPTNHSFGLHPLAGSLWFGLAGVVTACLYERLRRARTGFDEARDRPRRRAGSIVAIVVGVLYLVAMALNFMPSLFFGSRQRATAAPSATAQPR